MNRILAIEPGDAARANEVREQKSRRRAPRWSLSDLPWLSSVRLPWGQHLHLLNISSGMLVESSVRLAPGSQTSFKIRGPGLDLLVRGRVIRSRVAKVDSQGIKYEAAAAFDQPVDMLKAPEEAPADFTTQLAELVATIEAHAERGTSPAALRAEFEAGVLELIMAREVRLRDVPVVESDGRESVYFAIPTSDGSPAVLQVTFNANDQPSAEDFEVLTAAADVAASVLPLTGTTRHTNVRPQLSVIHGTTLRLVGERPSRELQIA